MKRLLLEIGSALFVLTLSAAAQTQGGPGPRAWGDKDKDGKCDITGQAVGQGRGKGMAAARRGDGRRGRCPQPGCCRRGQLAPAQNTPAPEPEK